MSRFLESGLLKTLLRFFETRQVRETLLKHCHLTLHVHNAAARPLKLQLELCFAPGQRQISVHEPFEERGEFLGALGEFGDFMLTEHLHPRHHVSRRNGQYLASFVLNGRRVRHRAFERVAAFGWTVRSHE